MAILKYSRGHDLNFVPLNMYILLHILSDPKTDHDSKTDLPVYRDQVHYRSNTTPKRYPLLLE